MSFSIRVTTIGKFDVAELIVCMYIFTNAFMQEFYFWDMTDWIWYEQRELQDILRK